MWFEKASVADERGRVSCDDCGRLVPRREAYRVSFGPRDVDYKEVCPNCFAKMVKA